MTCAGQDQLDRLLEPVDIRRGGRQHRFCKTNDSPVNKRRL